MQLPQKLLAMRTANVIDTPLSITSRRPLARLCLKIEKDGHFFHDPDK